MSGGLARRYRRSRFRARAPPQASQPPHVRLMQLLRLQHAFEQLPRLRRIMRPAVKFTNKRLLALDVCGPLADMLLRQREELLDLIECHAHERRVQSLKHALQPAGRAAES